MGARPWGARTIFGSGQGGDSSAEEIKVAGKPASTQSAGMGVSLFEWIAAPEKGRLKKGRRGGRNAH